MSSSYKVEVLVESPMGVRYDVHGFAESSVKYTEGKISIYFYLKLLSHSNYKDLKWVLISRKGTLSLFAGRKVRFQLAVTRILDYLREVKYPPKQFGTDEISLTDIVIDNSDLENPFEAKIKYLKRKYKNILFYLPSLKFVLSSLVFLFIHLLLSFNVIDASEILSNILKSALIAYFIYALHLDFSKSLFATSALLSIGALANRKKLPFYKPYKEVLRHKMYSYSATICILVGCLIAV